VTAEAKHLIEDFEKLPDAEKREVLSELLHVAQRLEYPTISEDEIVSAANAVFLEYDRRETGE
jgi:NADH:ubiquinone oxidoreductase subunit E